MKISLKSAGKVICFLTLVAIAIAVLVKFFKLEGSYGQIAAVLVLYSVMGVVGIWTGWRITGWLGDRAGRLYWPADSVVPPPPYFLIERYILRGELGRALEEYEKILLYHVRELPAHKGRLEMMTALQYPYAKIEKAYLNSLKSFDGEEDRDELQQCFLRCRERIANLRH